MSTRARTLLWQAYIAAILATGTAYGDLYSHGVLTLDWLVDSSDEIYLVHYVTRGSDGGLNAELRESLKPRGGKSPLATKDLARLRPPRCTTHAGDWLLFVRVLTDGRRRVVRGIDLQHPRESFKTAAFRKNGEPIEDPDAILAAVQSRIRLGRRLPAKCDRFAVDELIRFAQTNGSQSILEETSPYGDPAPLERFLGGMLIRIGFDWSSDIWLCVAVVPVEPVDHNALLEAAREKEWRQGASRFCHPVPCLINFPGQRTEQCLREIVREDRSRRFDDVASARAVLTYLRYRMPLTDPLNAKLIGSWQLDGQRERIDLEFAADNTFTAQAYDFPGSRSRENPRKTWRGTGFWAVHDGRLSVFRSHAWSGRNERTIFQDKLVKQLTPTEVRLEGGPLMRRKQ